MPLKFLSILSNLYAKEKEAWRTMMNGSEKDASTVFGEEGKNYIEWTKAADAVREFRSQHEDWAEKYYDKYN